MLVFFRLGEMLQVAMASAPSALSDSASPGNMMVRPAGTGQLKELFTNAFNAGVREINAIPFIGKDISRGGVGTADRWMAQASSQLISMPLGEMIKIALSERFSNVSLSLNSIIIKYLDRAGNVKATYTLTPTDASTGMHETSLAAPSASGSVRCQIVVDFTISGTMASSDSVSKSVMRIGLGGSYINTAVSTLERYVSSWSAISSITTLGGRYRFTATDAQDTTSDDRSSIMNYIESLPRRSSNAANISIYPALSLDGARFNSST